MTKLAAYTGNELAAEAEPFARVRELGFEAIEIAGIVLPLPEAEAGLAEWSDRLRRLGLEPRFHCKPRDNREFYNADSAARSECLHRTTRDIRNASRLGVRSVVIHPSAAAGPEDRRRVIDALERLKKQADEVGVQLELECASGPFNGDPRELAALCKAVPGVGIALDIVHAARSVFCREGAGTLAEWIEIAAPHIQSIQFNDVTRDGDRFIQTAVDHGEMPYDKIMSPLVEVGCAWWTIELQSIKHLVESKRYLEQFLR